MLYGGKPGPGALRLSPAALASAVGDGSAGGRLRAKEELSRKAQQLQELLVKTISIQEEERARIATDMHDGATQLIVGAGYKIQAARERLAAEPEVAETKLRTAQALLDRIEAEIRQAIYDLRPPILSTAGLIPALKGLCNEFQALTSVPCLCRVTGDLLRLPAEVEVAVYRIVQEALHNVEAHAVASTTQVSLQFRSEGLLRNLGAANRTQAVARAIREGLI